MAHFYRRLTAQSSMSSNYHYVASIFLNFGDVIVECCVYKREMMNCFCGMVDRRKAFSLISDEDHCQRYSPSQISDTRQ